VTRSHLYGLAVALAIVVTGCSVSVDAHVGTTKPTLNTGNLERYLTTIVQNRTGLHFTVSCPQSPAGRGVRTTCSLRGPYGSRVVATVVQTDAQGHVAANLGPDPVAVTRACSARPAAEAIAPSDVAFVRKLASCAVERIRSAAGLSTQSDARLDRATEVALDKAVALNDRTQPSALTDVVAAFEQAYGAPRPAPVSRLIDLYRCSQPAWIDFGDDSGPHGTWRTTVGIPQSIEGDFALALAAPGSTIAVATRPGRFLEGRSSGAVAVLLTVLCK
jgi:hypothetical protein